MIVDIIRVNDAFIPYINTEKYLYFITSQAKKYNINSINKVKNVYGEHYEIDGKLCYYIKNLKKWVGLGSVDGYQNTYVTEKYQALVNVSKKLIESGWEYAKDGSGKHVYYIMFNGKKYYNGGYCSDGTNWTKISGYYSKISGNREYVDTNRLQEATKDGKVTTIDGNKVDWTGAPNENVKITNSEDYNRIMTSKSSQKTDAQGVVGNADAQGVVGKTDAQGVVGKAGAQGAATTVTTNIYGIPQTETNVNRVKGIQLFLRADRNGHFYKWGETTRPDKGIDGKYGQNTRNAIIAYIKSGRNKNITDYKTFLAAVGSSPESETQSRAADTEDLMPKTVKIDNLPAKNPVFNINNNFNLGKISTDYGTGLGEGISLMFYYDAYNNKNSEVQNTDKLQTELAINYWSKVYDNVDKWKQSINARKIVLQGEEDKKKIAPISEIFDNDSDYMRYLISEINLKVSLCENNNTPITADYLFSLTNKSITDSIEKIKDSKTAKKVLNVITNIKITASSCIQNYKMRKNKIDREEKQSGREIDRNIDNAQIELNKKTAEKAKEQDKIAKEANKPLEDYAKSLDDYTNAYDKEIKIDNRTQRRLQKNGTPEYATNESRKITSQFYDLLGRMKDVF